MSNNFWNSYASDFDAIYDTKNSLLNTLINNLFRKGMKLRFEKTIESIPQNAGSVIDIGCGAGHFCISLAKKGIQKIQGIDYSENMIQLAKKHASETNTENQITYSVEDFMKYSPSAKYDYSIVMGFVEYFEKPEIIIKKAIDLTNKKIFISFPEKQGFLAWQRKVRYKSKCFLKLYDRKDIIELMEAVKARNYTIDKLSRDYFVTISL